MQIAEIALKWLTKWIAGRCESSKARLEHFYPPRVLSRRLIAFSRKMVSQCREPLPIDMKDPLSGQTTAERASPNELGIGKGTNHPMPRQNASFTWTQTPRMPLSVKSRFRKWRAGVPFTVIGGTLTYCG